MRIEQSEKVIFGNKGDGRELESKGLLKFVKSGQTKVIGETDSESYIGTSALVTCAGVGIWDEYRKIAGITHISFEGCTLSNWYELIGIFSNNLVSMAQQEGGILFHIFLVNVASGYRRPHENKILTDFMTHWIHQRTRKENDITEVTYYNAESFCIHKNTGSILLY